MTTEHKIQSIIEQLENLQNVLKDARPKGSNGYTSETSYPYAVGYTKGGISNAVFDLRQLLK